MSESVFFSSVKSVLKVEWSYSVHVRTVQLKIEIVFTVKNSGALFTPGTAWN